MHTANPSQTGPSLSALLQRALARHPDRSAFVWDGGDLSPGCHGGRCGVGRLGAAEKGAVQAPKHVEFITEMPRTAVGKIDKKALRQPFWDGQARQVG